MTGFYFRNMSEPLKNSVPMPTAKYFKGIDPQSAPVVTSGIAPGYFKDDIRRMRMATWNGTGHIMAIRTTGQNHIDGLMEGTPEGIGGVPIIRKQLRASRKTCDLIESEVGRPINFHSYVPGVADPEAAVLFIEEGVNDAHQDPQYNVLYCNINAYRGYVGAGEAKKVAIGARIFQVDGAHNVNTTARQGWRVVPELMVQHDLNSTFFVTVRIPKDLIGPPTVPPSAPSTPKLWFDLSYMVALHDFFSGHEMRTQQDTRYIESDISEAIRLHMIDTMISMLASADVQNTTTPDERRNLPQYYSSVRGVQTVKQAWVTLDGVKGLLTLNREGPLGGMVRDLKGYTVDSPIEVLYAGGYFAAAEQGLFIDSAEFPERNHNGIARDGDGGISVGIVVERNPDYLMPVCDHFGSDNPPTEVDRVYDLVGGYTLCDLEKIVYTDELDPKDSAHKRLRQTREHRSGDLLRPEAEWAGDGVVLTELMILERVEIAVEVVLEVAKCMGLSDPKVANLQVLQPAKGCFAEVKGHVGFDVDKTEPTIPEEVELLPEEELRQFVTSHEITVVASTVNEDEHSADMREILDIRHDGLEKYGIKYRYLGTSVPVKKMMDVAIESGPDTILIFTVTSHNEVHHTMVKELAELTKERDIRDEKVLIAGGTQVSRDMATKTGLNTAFGRDTKNIDVLDTIVCTMRGREQEKVR